MAKKSKQNTTEDEYNNALATEDPTVISQDDLQDLAKKAISKFKSLN